MQIQLRINEEGLLRNQHHAFTDRHTLVTELLQNARRAGATRIDVTFDETRQWLRVVDDGCGVSDFQNLLTFYLSGWDDATREEEHPFGIGFSKCLYASTRCIVTSRGRRIDIDTRRVLARNPVDVLDAPDGLPAEGAAIELHGVELSGLATRIDSLCQGFPVDVAFNGVPVERPYAEAHLATMPSSIGSVHLAEVVDGWRAHDTLVFLQGMCVMRPRWQGGAMDVVHLDPRRFMARLPDRYRLIDEDLQRMRIHEALRSCWRVRLLEKKRTLSAADFLDRYYPAIRAWDHLDLLNEIDMLPMRICHSIDGYPVQEVGTSEGHLASLVSPVSRSAVESGSVKLADLGPVDEENAACWMLARARGYLMVDSSGLHAEHWVQPLLKPLDGEPVRVEAVGETHRTRLEGNWIAPELVLCGSVRIQVGAEVADVADAGVFHEDCLYIPAGESSGEPVRQVSTYTDGNDQFQECDLEIDRRMLEEEIRRLRATDPATLLESMLRLLSLGSYPVLHGRSFMLSIGVGGAPGFSIEESSIGEGGVHAER